MVLTALSGGWLSPGRARVEQGVEGGQDRQLRVLGVVVAAALELVDLQSERGATGDGPEPPREERGGIVWSAVAADLGAVVKITELARSLEHKTDSIRNCIEQGIIPSAASASCRYRVGPYRN